MELHRLLFLVITIVVSISAHGLYNPLNDVNSYERHNHGGLPIPYELNHKHKHHHYCDVDTYNKGNYELLPPLYNNMPNGGKKLEGSLARARYGKKRRLKLQEEESIKVRKLMATVKKALPPLTQLLKYDLDSDDDGDNSYRRQ